ncbi:MAG: hypothetical protein LQ346_003492 [Caloplaca aetnensis]|nr:MAG: hypothetical protein LQ346_003492 [Caloplaca aetnensis]
MSSSETVNLTSKARIESPSKIFPFLKLPFEIRQLIYASALPRQDIPIRSGEWVDQIEGVPNQCMNILLANKQISDEAHAVLYGSNTFTIEIEQCDTNFLHVTQQTHDFIPFPSMRLVHYVKNWQLDLRDFHHSQRNNGYVEEKLLAASAELALAAELQTLKIMLPCLCFKMGSTTPTCDVYHQVSSALDPLRRLRFKRGVRFIAGNQYPGWASQEPYAQCQKPECLGFANSFHKTRAIMEGDTVPSPFTSRQLWWFDLKEQVSKIVASQSGLDCALSRVWRGMAAPKAEFDENVKDCLGILRDEWDNQRRDGRLTCYRRYERKGIPEQNWECIYYHCIANAEDV